MAARLLIVIALVAVGCWTKPARAGEASAEVASVEAIPAAEYSTDASAEIKQPEGVESGGNGTEGEDEEGKPKTPLLDKMHAGVEGSIERTARFFDGFFGGRRYADSGESYGRIITDLFWQNREGFDPHVRMRAKYNLPGMSNRVNAVLGRGDTDQLLNDYETDFTDLFPTERDEEWLAGFGYAPPWSRSRRVSLGGGVRFSGGVQPYVRMSYNFRQELGERTIMTLRPTGFWRNDEGFGWAVNFDVEHKLNERSMFRLTLWSEQAEESPGVRHETYLTYYQQLSNSRGFSVQAGFNGETEGEPPIYDYGGRITYRQRIWREWLFIKYHVGVSWLREDLAKDRRADPVLGIGFDLIYGTKPEPQRYVPPQE